MERLTDDADYDAGEMSGNVPRPRSDSGNLHAYYALWTRCVPLGRPINMTKLLKQGQLLLFACRYIYISLQRFLFLYLLSKW
ncbi:unnamed protein product [Protopolystoma xenopodis]|uniref:Uncharacterized protein n=1 Tax=Protopolystoma xenopodis TaxID=117903 RepID=A0A3S5BVE8_9PLAT|nr:unnamed protein product [Protopolystoma xenopodis]